jgi:hypothetical protein
MVEMSPEAASETTREIRPGFSPEQTAVLAVLIVALVLGPALLAGAVMSHASPADEPFNLVFAPLAAVFVGLVQAGAFGIGMMAGGFAGTAITRRSEAGDHQRARFASSVAGAVLLSAMTAALLVAQLQQM